VHEKLAGEVCGNGTDDDGDMMVDCADDECFAACVSDCADRCATAEGDRCTEDGHPAHCQRVSSGCTDLVVLSGCPFDRLCNSGACIDGGTCVDGCTAGATRCGGC
jgi:hypothetical protein